VVNLLDTQLRKVTDELFYLSILWTRSHNGIQKPPCVHSWIETHVSHISVGRQQIEPALNDNTDLISDQVPTMEHTGMLRFLLRVYAESGQIELVLNAPLELALMIIFVATVYETLAMPQFDNSLLGLMGISSAAYAGMKIPENKQ
jgi:hypothetical protein